MKPWIRLSSCPRLSDLSVQKHHNCNPGNTSRSQVSSLDSASWRIILKKSSSFIHSHTQSFTNNNFCLSSQLTHWLLGTGTKHNPAEPLIIWLATQQLGTQEVWGKQPCFSTCSTQLGPSHSRHSPIWWVSTYPITAHKKGAEPTGVGYGKEKLPRTGH